MEITEPHSTGLTAGKIVTVGAKELDAVVRRRNELVMGNYRLSLQAHRLFLYVVAQVQDDHDETTEYEFSINELARAIGIERAGLYRSMVEVLDELAATMVNVEAVGENREGGKVFVRIGLIRNRQRVRLSQKGETLLDGRMAVSVYKELLPYVRRLRERYTETELKYVMRLSSSYSQRLYDLLKSNAYKGHWRVGREELIALLAVEKGRFELWGDFRRYVLEKAQTEISTSTDLAFDVEYITSGRTVVELVFRMRKEGGHDVEALPGTPRYHALRGMMELGLSAKEAQKVLARWWAEDPERVRWHVAEAKRMAAIGKVHNVVGWFRAGLNKDYRPQRSLFTELKRTADRKRTEYREERAQAPSGEAEPVKDGLARALDDLARNLGREGGERK